MLNNWNLRKIKFYIEFRDGFNIMIALTLCRGNYAEAIINYEKGLQLTDVDEQKQDISEHKKLCQYGIARTSIKNGDYRKGVNAMA